MNDQKLKHKLYVIIFESDTPSGKLFDVVLIGCILASVLLVIIESLKGLPSYLTTPFVVMEYLSVSSALLTCWLPCRFTSV